MKTRTMIWLTTLTLVSASALAQDAIKLARLFEVGQTDSYKVVNKVVSTVDMSAMGAGEQETAVDSSFEASYRIAGIKDNVADLDITYNNFKLDIKGEMASQMGLSADMFPKEAKASGKMDATGTLSDYKLLDEKLKGSMAMMGGETALESFNWIRLPKGDLIEGTEFKVELPKMPMYVGDKNTFDGKVMKIVDFDGVPAVQVVYGGTLQIDMDMSEMMKNNPNASEMPPMKMTMTGEAKMSFTVFFEQKSGKVLKMEYFTTGNQKINLTDMGMSIPLTVETSTTLVLKK